PHCARSVILRRVGVRRFFTNNNGNVTMRILFSSAFSVLAMLLAGLAHAGVPTSGRLPLNESGVPTLAPIIEEATRGVVNISTHTLIELRHYPQFNYRYNRHHSDIPMPQLPRNNSSLCNWVNSNQKKWIIPSDMNATTNSTENSVTLCEHREHDAEVVGTDA